MRLVFLGSGAFGLPTLERLAPAHEIALVVSQPDRPAGRRRRATPTPVAERAQRRGFATIKPRDVNEPATVRAILGAGADAVVVIAYGQKLGPGLLAGPPAVNLHGSLLPKCRGAAPIQWTMINGEKEAGVTAIEVAPRMDAGAILGQRVTPIDPRETAGELHDRLAALGPEVMLEVLEKMAAGTLAPREQDETLATRAPRLTKADGTVDFAQPAEAVRCRVHGLTPWPGCTVVLNGARLLLRRVEIAPGGEPGSAPRAPGSIGPDGAIACAPGAVRLETVQAAGGKPMSFAAYRRGHDVPAGSRLAPL